MSARDLFSPYLSGDTSAYTTYLVELQVRDKLIGGVPKDPDTIKKWIQARLELDDRALLELVNETATAMEAESGQRPSGDELVEAVAREFEGGNGFKSIDGQLVYEGRCMKAALKEACNVAYPGTDWPSKNKIAPKFRKGLMSTFAERVFVDDLYIPLGVTTPSGTEQRIKHVMTPQGPRSAINVVDYVEQPKIRFTLRVLDDFLSLAEWSRIWQLCEEIGIGADRARSDGKFDLLTFDKTD